MPRLDDIKKRIRDCLEPRGYTVHADDYKDKTSEIRFTCPKGHDNVDRWTKISKRAKVPANICLGCSGKKPLPDFAETYKAFQDECGAYGFTVVTPFSEWEGVKRPVTIRCPEGHEDTLSRSQGFKQRKRDVKCSGCSGDKRFNRKPARTDQLLRDVTAELTGLGMTVITKEMVVRSDFIKYRCTEGHANQRTFVTWPRILCTECAKDGRDPHMRLLINSCRGVDKRYGRECNIDYDWIEEQNRKQEGKCYYTGVPLLREYAQVTSMSVDRLNNGGLGHTRDNCVLVATPVNYCKNSMNHDEFITWIRDVTRITEAPEPDEVHLRLKCKNARALDAQLDMEPSLMIDDLTALIKDAGNRCAVTGIPLVWKTGANLGSLDRLDNNQPHSADNLQPVLLPINRMKNVRFNNADILPLWQALVERHSMSPLEKSIGHLKRLVTAFSASLRAVRELVGVPDKK